MKVVKISDAKNNLSRHLEYVKRGGRVRIVDRDVPVADLVPIEIGAAQGDDEALLASLEQRGLVRRGKGGRLPADLLAPGVASPRARVLDALIEERRSSR